MTVSPKLIPSAQAFVSTFRTSVDYTGVPIQYLRDNASPMLSDDIPRPKVVIEKMKIPCYTDGHLIPVDVYRPASAYADEILPVLVYFPGGAFTLPPQGAHPYLATKLAGETHCAVFFVNYSLSPEVKFPVATEECYSVIKYVSNPEHAKASRIDPIRVAVGGDSAGGNLAIITTLLAKQRNLENKIKYQVLYYPATDASLSSESYKQFADGYFLTKAGVEYHIKKYLSSDEDKNNKFAFPVNATVEDLIGLPAGLLVTAEADVLRDEGEDYARKLLEANVPVSSFRVLGTVHGFMSVAPLHSTETLQIIDLTTSALRKIFS
ncbi:Alpha/Beta hydrolase protein [Helicostylum pulchrum]|nr:Alpha/Beta hydrolase protein [Helicostylum pulchrum]